MNKNLIFFIVLVMISGCFNSPSVDSTLTDNSSPPDQTAATPDQNHAIIITNNANESLNGSLILYNNGEEVHSETVQISKYADEREVFNTNELNNTGVTKYRVSLKLADGRSSETRISTNRCFGKIQFIIPKRGDIEVGRGMC